MGNAELTHRGAVPLGQGLGPRFVGVRQDYREFLSAVARNKIRGATGIASQDSSDAPKAIVAGDMAIAVVEGFEKIHVQQKQRQGRCAPLPKD